MPNIKHWFNGLGYLHEFKFDDGELQYSASYVPCTQYEAAMPKSKVGERISTEQDWVPASGAPYVPNTGVTIRMVGDHQVLVNTGYSGSNEAGPGATWLETPFQYTGTPLQPDQGAPAPSHSQTDPDGRVFMFNALFGGASGAGYQLYTVAPGSTEQQQLNILGPNPALGVPTYQHAFSITSNYVVLIEQPCTYGQHGWDTFKWIPEIGTHWRIVRYVPAPCRAIVYAPAHTSPAQPQDRARGVHVAFGRCFLHAHCQRLRNRYRRNRARRCHLSGQLAA